VTGTRQYQHRQEWRTGADQAQQIPTQKSTSDPKLVAAAELRFLLSGVTSIVGSGGTQGLVRNLAAAPAKLEGLQGKPVYFDSFPLGDSNGPPKRARQFGTHFAMSPSRGPTLVVCS
jgi:hypothetical protein